MELGSIQETEPWDDERIRNFTESRISPNQENYKSDPPIHTMRLFPPIGEIETLCVAIFRILFPVDNVCIEVAYDVCAEAHLLWQAEFHDVQTSIMKLFSNGSIKIV